MKRRVFSRTLCASACYLNFIRSPKSSNPHTLVPPPPSHTARGLILKRYTLTDVWAAPLIRLAGKAAGSVSATALPPSQPESERFSGSLELTWLRHMSGLRIKEDAGGMCCTSTPEIRWSRSYCLCLISSKRTHSLGISGLWFCVTVCVSAWNHWGMQLSLSPDRHFSEMWANNWEHKRGAKGGVSVNPTVCSRFQTSFC